MAEKVKVGFRVDFRFEFHAEDDESYTSLEFLSIAKALRDALEGMMDGSDTIHDYVSEELPSGVGIKRVSLGEIVLNSISGGKGEK